MVQFVGVYIPYRIYFPRKSLKCLRSLVAVPCKLSVNIGQIAQINIDNNNHADKALSAADFIWQ